MFVQEEKDYYKELLDKNNIDVKHGKKDDVNGSKNVTEDSKL